MNEIVFVQLVVDAVYRHPDMANAVVIFSGIIWPLLIGWVLVGWHHRGLWGVTAILAGVDTFLLVGILKWLVARPRPVLAMIEPLLVPLDQYSFPSGHAAIAMMLATLSFTLDRRVGYVGVILAVLIGVSRVLAGVHYPSDVVVGWAAGVVIGWLWLWAATRLRKKHLSIAQ